MGAILWGEQLEGTVDVCLRPFNSIRTAAWYAVSPGLGAKSIGSQPASSGGTAKLSSSTSIAAGAAAAKSALVACETQSEESAYFGFDSGDSQRACRRRLGCTKWSRSSPAKPPTWGTPECGVCRSPFSFRW